MREARGMNLEEAGALMERSISSLSKLENGRVKLPARDVRALLDFYGVTDERTRESLMALARDSHKRGWWQQYGDSLSASYMDFISLEADAVAVRTFQTNVIPGLLQTPDYARALIAAVPGLTGPLDVDQLVTVRMARGEVLTRPDPLCLWAILDEAVLRRHMGGRDTMRFQLLRLIEAGQSENIVIQVMPYAAGAHAGTSGPFTTLEFPQLADLDVVLVETLTSGLYLESEDEIRRYRLVFDHLRMSALPEAESQALIERAAKDLE
ncbi:MAG: putative DNA-binding protein in cluster with Type restriction-modification system [Actinomycetia bacterium]|nr:putative DNA-binding protein in cluster with Type restriction-modification system [Actinomycetes bacterium]